MTQSMTQSQIMIIKDYGDSGGAMTSQIHSDIHIQ